MAHSFAEKYKTLSDLQLIGILHNRGDYKPEAIEAAEHELGRRNISPAAWQEAQQEDKPIETPFFSSLYEKLHQLVVKIYFGHGLHPTERMVNAISIWLVLSSLGNVLKMFSSPRLVIYLIKSGDVMGLILLIAPPVLSWAIAYYFRKRKKAAWIILSVFTYIYLVGEIISWWIYLNRDLDLPMLIYRKGIYDLVAFALNATMLYHMNKRRMRALFRITFNWQVMSFCLALFIIVVVTRYVF